MTARRPHGVLLSVAYDGEPFHGWQRQAHVPTVQGTLEAALDALGVEHSAVRGASRTDAGVHAEGQRAAFATTELASGESWLERLDEALPDSIQVRAAESCPARYQPRFHAARKLYRYLAAEPRAQLEPGLERRCWRRAIAGIDVTAMARAAEHLEGTHDFRAFRHPSDRRTTTLRMLQSVVVTERDGVVVITVEGDAFMKQMVRIIAGTLLDVGLGRRTPDQVADALRESATRDHAGPTAPPEGLTLMQVVLRESLSPTRGFASGSPMSTRGRKPA